MSHSQESPHLYIYIKILLPAFTICSLSPNICNSQERFAIKILDPFTTSNMGNYSRNLFSTWVGVFLTLGSTACAYVTVITATTFAQPTFV
jgi:hypothetical protein